MKCPICESWLSHYQDYGRNFAVLRERQVIGGVRQLYVRCPVCHGLSRTRLMYLYLSRVAKISNSQRILHISPELGLVRWLSRQRLKKYILMDLQPWRYRRLISGVQKGDLTSLHFPGSSFDIVICSHVLEHVVDDRLALGELRRILAPGGVALLMVPEAIDGGGNVEEIGVADRKKREIMFGQDDHVRIYSREGFTARIIEAGLRVSNFNGFSEFPEVSDCYRLDPLEILRIATRP